MRITLETLRNSLLRECNNFNTVSDMGATRAKGLKTERRRNIPAASPDAMALALESGQEVAWVMRSPAGATCGVSAVHRVFGGGKTFCSHTVPPEPQRFPPLKSLDVCSACDRLWKRASAVEAQEERRREIA